MSNHDRVSGRTASTILGLGYPGAFNSSRKRLERVLNRDTATHEHYPTRLELERLAQPRETADDAETRFRGQAILVVPEWGGVSICGGDWSYSRAACERWLRRLIGGVDE